MYSDGCRQDIERFLQENREKAEKYGIAFRWDP